MAADVNSRSAADGSAGAAGVTGASDVQERRARAGLRALVDEMLTKIRSAASHEEAWEADERRRAEEDLARIMEQVRAEALATRSGR